MCEIFKPTGFDQQVAIEKCKIDLCVIGNDALQDGEGYCMYMEQTSPLNDITITTEQLATDPGMLAG